MGPVIGGSRTVGRRPHGTVGSSLVGQWLVVNVIVVFFAVVIVVVW